MSIGGLGAALSGLRVAQQQLSVISANIANVGTPGYTRKILPQSSQAIEGTTIGVRGDPIIRKVNLNLERDYWTQVSASSFYDTQVAYLDRIQQFHGPPDKELSIAADIARLRDSFSALADSPEDTYLQRSAVNQGVTVANKFNEFADLLTEMRNDSQDDISLAVNDINVRLQAIADLNDQIKKNISLGKTTADYEDSRDENVRIVSEYLNVSFFTRSDGVMVLQTTSGVELVADEPLELFFDPSPIGADNYYPVSAAGLYVGGDPDENRTSIEISDDEHLGGKLGALLELRDAIIPRQIAQLDELAHKMALRFDAQGLRLFTGANGTIPADTAPVPDPPGPLTPVTYVGFASQIRVNQQVQSDNSLVQSGTVANDLTVQPGSNEVIRRIVEFAFGDVEYQEAEGTIDLRAAGTGGTTLQPWLGLFSQNQVISNVNLSQYSDLDALINAGGDVFDPIPPGPPLNDVFRLTFSDPRLGIPDATYDLDLSAINTAYPIGGAVTDALDQLISAINNLAPPPNAAFDVQASRGPYGQLIISSRANIVIDASTPASGMRQEGLDFLGFTEGTYETVDPYFEVQIGRNNPVTVTIEPGDDETDLMAKLEYNSGMGTGIPGLYANMAAGLLTLRPGNDNSNGGPVFGGDMRLVGGPFEADGSGGSGVAAGATVLEALFGSNSPVANVLHSTTTAFRFQNLGPSADINTGIISATSLIDFSQRMVNKHTEEVISAETQRDDEVSFRDLLQRQLLDESAVNIDEELSLLITVQTAYAAAARAVTAVQTMFDELINAVR